MRRRSWALEEELFGPDSSVARERLLEALDADLVQEESDIAHIAEQLGRHAERVAGLRRRLEALRQSPRTPPLTSDAIAGAGRAGAPVRATAGHDYRLCRCEGFDVESPTRRVGVVDGLRYHSRIDRPDALEVRAGPLGRQLLLIPVEEVDRILFEEGRLILRSTPHMRHEHLHDLLLRLRSRRQNGAPRVS